jgi:HK97 family phage prohead protease
MRIQAMKMLHKDFGLELKQVDDEGIIEGYASVFGGAPDLYGDVIAKGAFTATLAAHEAAGTAPLMLWGHDSFSPPIGSWNEIREDRKGLWVSGSIDLDDPMGQRVHRGLKRKAMRGLSIGYETKEAEADPKRPGVRILTAVDLWEVSPVNFPAQQRAAVENVKSFTAAGSLPSLQDFEDFLRESGFSKSLAVAIASKGLAHLLRSESADGDRAAQFLRGLKG